MLSTEEVRAVRQTDVRALIRAAHEDDAAILLDHYHCLAVEPVNNTSVRRDVLDRTVAQQRACIRESRDALFVAEYRGVIAGTVKCMRSPHPLIDHAVEISINVGPRFRGMGLGSALLKHAIAWAQRERAITRVQLEVLTRNESARRLYERLGFVYEGTRRRAYHLHDEDTYADAIMMALLLD